MHNLPVFLFVVFGIPGLIAALIGGDQNAAPLGGLIGVMVGIYVIKTEKEANPRWSDKAWMPMRGWTSNSLVTVLLCAMLYGFVAMLWRIIFKIGLLF